MGLMGTLAKVAIGYAASQAVSKATQGGGLGDLMGQLTGGANAATANAQAGANSIQDMLGNLTGGAAQTAQAGTTGVQDMLGGLMGGAAGGAGGLQDMLGGLMGGQQGEAAQQSGGLQSMLGGMTGGGAGLAGLLAAAGGMAAASGGSGGGALAGMLDQMAGKEPEAEEGAALMLKAMIQASKADGQIDASEQERILGSLGDDADAEEIAFVQAELAAPIDVQGLANATPAAKRPEVYAMSLMAIKVDTQGEAQYLNDLAQAMGLDQQQVNMIHGQMGVQPLYS